MMLARADQLASDEPPLRGGPQPLQRLLVLAPIVVLFSVVALTAARGTQSSISSYHGTQFRDVFVAALVGTAIALLGFWGVTPLEDYVLNVAGLYAVMVALVPNNLADQISTYPQAGRCSCLAADDDWGDPLSVARVIVGCVLATAAAFAIVDRIKGQWSLGLMAKEPADPSHGFCRRVLAPRNIAIGSLSVLGAYLVWVAIAFTVPDTLAWLPLSFRLQWVHSAAAILLFVHLAVAIGAQGWKLMPQDVEPDEPRRRRYRIVFWLMPAAILITYGVVTWVFHASTFVFWLEVVEIALFAVFWIDELRRAWKIAHRPSAQA